jgi:hypothetical protein
MSMTTRAAVCRAPGQPWEITDLELDEPKANEVRIKFHAAGLCHSDDHIQKGAARRAEGARGPGEVLRGRAVPLRRPHHQGRRCAAEVPELRAMGSDEHLVACHFPLSDGPGTPPDDRGELEVIGHRQPGVP